MQVYNIKNIELSIFHDTDIVLNEPIIKVNGEDIHSASRYGFRKDELLSIIGESNTGTMYTTRYGTPELKINDDFRKNVFTKPTFTVGICAGRPMVHSIERLRDLGFNPTFESDRDRDIRIKSDDYIKNGNSFYKVEYLLVKELRYSVPVENKCH